MSDCDSTVQYRDIEGFPGYRVGDDGSVWTRWRKLGRGCGQGTTQILGDAWQRMKPSPGSQGHMLVTLCPGRHMRLVHRLVLEAFVGPCPPGMQCRHFPDRDPANNSLGNIQWGTPKENQADRLVHGTGERGSRHPNGKYAKGSKHYGSKLDEGKVRAIRQEYASGETTYAALGGKYGVDHTAIYLVVKRRNWKHVL